MEKSKPLEILLVVSLVVFLAAMLPLGAGKRVVLTDAEAATLTFICEEEKLAKEVYETYFAVWGSTIFEKISESETNHLATMQKMMAKFGLPDPTLTEGFGEFDNDELQSLFLSMTEPLPDSALEGYWVGGLIEETDIRDITEAIEQLEAGSDSEPLLNAYGNLLRGSRNHLRAFARNIEAAGEVYVAQVLDQETVDAILDSGTERGPYKNKK